MMITITTRSGSETYEGEFVNGLRHGKVIDHFLSSTQTPHTFHIMENFFGKQLLRKPLREGEDSDVDLGGLLGFLGTRHFCGFSLRAEFWQNIFQT